MANHPGWKAQVFTPLHTLVSLLLFVECSVLLGLALWPAVLLWQRSRRRSRRRAGTGSRRSASPRWPATSWQGWPCSSIVPVARWVLFATGTPVGRFPYLSWGAYRWASYNALTLLVRFSFINWIRVTPFLPLFHRLMGMKVGRRVQFNTAVVADQNLIEVGDDSVVGGDVTLVCHAAESGALVTAPTRVGRRVTIGIMAVILPGCTIGDDAVVAAGAIVTKGTVIEPGEIWAGIPARCVGRRGHLPAKAE